MTMDGVGHVIDVVALCHAICPDHHQLSNVCVIQSKCVIKRKSKRGIDDLIVVNEQV